jgi:serine protease inhibitor
MKPCQQTLAFLTVSFAVCFVSDAQLEQPESPDKVTAALANLFSQHSSNSGTLLLLSPAEQPEPLVEANTAFALDLFNQLKVDSGNLFFSPYVISTALALTYAGARGQTEKQMRNVLHFANVQEVPSHFGLLQGHLLEVGKQKGVELSIANALWAEQGYPFLPAFLSNATGSYEANINQANFVTGADAARNQINAWVAQQTQDKIQNILPPSCPDPNTRLVLASAIYFKGLWQAPFDKSRTSIQAFYLTPSHPVDATLMHQTEMAGYTENNYFQAVELPYQGGLNLVIFLRRPIIDRGVLEDSLTPAFISNALSQIKWQQVEIFLPRFKLESAFRLDNYLARMGMPDAFDKRADFSGMDGSTNLYISGVFHRSWCEVTEDGTEAAAAGIVLSSRGMEPLPPPPPPPPPIFRADHPFVFLIRDTLSGSILFMGRLANPSA